MDDREEISMYDHVDSVGDRSWSVVKLLIFQWAIIGFPKLCAKTSAKGILIFAWLYLCMVLSKGFRLTQRFSKIAVRI